MLHIDIIAVGRLKAGPLQALCADYAGRLKDWHIHIHEIDERKACDALVLDKMAEARYIFVLDERGRSLGSESFAEKLGTLEDSGCGRIAFAIGGADGHGEAVRKKADFLLSFGIQTWPHMLARVMLLEQIYRARQIIIGHPYHRA
jgi:23S rRNA (pseudouridine1915-N3)-methyltransferase